MAVQRRFVRWVINKPAQIRFEDAEAFYNCTVNDISLMGTKISLSLKLPKDTFVKLCLHLTEDFVLNIEAWSVWHRSVDGKHIYGLYFTKLRDADKEKIYQFIRKNYPDQMNKRWWDEAPAKKEKGGDEMEDRRIFQRFGARFPVTFLALDTGKEGAGETDDISAKGVGLTASEELPLKAPLEIWLRLPDEGEPLYTRGEVAWSCKSEFGKYRVGVNLERADLMGLSRVLRAI